MTFMLISIMVLLSTTLHIVSVRSNINSSTRATPTNARKNFADIAPP